MFNRILVPLDGSKLAELSIPHAEQFARIFGSTIILLQVLEPTSYHENPKPVDPLSWQIRKTEVDMYMQAVAGRILTDLGQPARDAAGTLSGSASHSGEGTMAEKKVRVEYSIREGRTAENIIDFAHNENIDLLILTTHGSSGLSRWNISSVVQKVINLIYLPVLIVRAYQSSGTEDARIRYRRILLPFDTSRRAEYSLAAGVALTQGETTMNPAVETGALAPLPVGSRVAGQADSIDDPAAFRSKLLLAAIIRPAEIPIPEPYPPEIGQLSEQLMHVSREAVNNYLDEMKLRLPVECEICIVENNSVPAAIHELADQEDVDLVVLTAHGYTGRFTWPYGTVTRNYIEHGTKSVLVIQDIPLSQVRPSVAEIAAKKTGRR